MLILLMTETLTISSSRTMEQTYFSNKTQLKTKYQMILKCVKTKTNKLGTSKLQDYYFEDFPFGLSTSDFVPCKLVMWKHQEPGPYIHQQRLHAKPPLPLLAAIERCSSFHTFSDGVSEDPRGTWHFYYC